MITTFVLVSAIGISIAAEKAPVDAKKTAKAPGNYSLYLKSGDKSPKWNEFIEPAFQSFESGNLATAYVFLNRAYNEGCRDGLVLFMLGLYKESKGAYKAASDLLALAAEKIPKQYPGHRFAKEIHEHAGRVLYQADDYNRALPELKKAIEAKPDNFMVLFMTGQILRVKKQYPEAKEMFEKAMKAAPPEGIAAGNAHLKITAELMMLSFELKEFDNCLKYADEILSINPNDPAAISYKQQIERERFKIKEKETIEKLVK